MPLKFLTFAVCGVTAVVVGSAPQASAGAYFGGCGGFWAYPSPDLNPCSRSYNPDAWRYMYKLNCIDAGRSLIARGFLAPRAPVRVSKVTRLGIVLRYALI